MDVPGAPTAASPSRRSALAGVVSVGIHGGALLAAALIVAHHDREPPVIELTPIQVVAAPVALAPPAPPQPAPVMATPGSPQHSSTSASTGTLGRRGRDAPQRSQTRAPATPDPFADVVVSYDKPTGPDPGNEAGTTGAGVGAGLLGDGTGNGTGMGQFGVGNVPPAPPSLARPPRPRSDYKNWNFRADRRFAGATVLVELSIDAAGHVRNVAVLRGVDESIDQHAATLARRFEFYPALDDGGKPIWGRHNWEFLLRGDGAVFDGLPHQRW